LGIGTFVAGPPIHNLAEGYAHHVPGHTPSLIRITDIHKVKCSKDAPHTSPPVYGRQPCRIARVGDTPNMPGTSTTGAGPQDLAGMMQVYSLATWEIKKDRPSSGWFIYQNESA
jgi:hypothetical protein